MKKYTQKTNEEYLRAIEEGYGIISLIADNLGITSSAVWQKIHNNKLLQEALEERRDRERKNRHRRFIVTYY